MLEKGIALAINEVLMVLGWLILVPAGIWMSTVGKRKFPEHWFCYHRTIMAIATISILTGATLAFCVTTPHFDSFYTIIGPILNLLLLVQATGGLVISMMETPSEHRPLINKLHKSLGLFVYLGGLVNGSLGLHAYSMSLSCHHAIYGLAMLMGVFLTVHVYLLSVILPAWWDNWSNDPQYEHIEIASSPQP